MHGAVKTDTKSYILRLITTLHQRYQRHSSVLRKFCVGCCVYNIIIIIIVMPMFIVLSSWQGHWESSLSSFDECRLKSHSHTWIFYRVLRIAEIRKTYTDFTIDSVTFCELLRDTIYYGLLRVIMMSLRWHYTIWYELLPITASNLRAF